jgi:hypothetical protein
MDNKTSFIIHSEWIEAMADLDDSTRLRLYEAMFAYAMSGTIPELSPLEKAVFALIRAQIDRSTERYEDSKQKRSEAAKKGAEARWAGKPELLEKLQPADAKRTQGIESHDAENAVDANRINRINRIESHDAENAVDAYNVDVNVDVIKRKSVKKENPHTPHIEFYDSCINNATWIDTVAMNHHLLPENIPKWFNAFDLDVRASGKVHANLQDCMTHFNKWLKLKLKEQQTNDRRSRTNIAPGEVKDYNSTF